MPPLPGRRCWFVAASLVFAAAIGRVAAESPATTTAGPTPYVFGARTCKSCHADASRASDNCRMNEWQVWADRDPHRLALDWGSNDDPSTWTTDAARRARSIGQTLGLADVATAPQCIGCHSVSAPADAPRQEFSPLDEGVSCVACHGAAEEWVLRHQATADRQWSALTRQQKQDLAGMTDLWNPSTRAETCLSCHLGDPDPSRGRSITHAMYAAGHPPLPPIEVASFSELQPRHWRLAREKPPSVLSRLGLDPDRLETTEQVIAGGRALLRRHAEILANSADRPDSPPEFARFDCASCHHSIQLAGWNGPSWRQRRALPGAPGRPTLPRWTSALAVAAGQQNAELTTGLAQLERSFLASPFGDPALTARAAGSLLGTSVDEPATVTPMDALQLLHSLGRYSAAQPPDLDTARQLAWAFRAIDGELSSRSDLLARDPQRQQLLTRLTHELRLDLEPRSSPPFDSTAFQQLFSDLVDTLPPPPR